jgi:hypothetical protein
MWKLSKVLPLLLELNTATAEIRVKVEKVTQNLQSRDIKPAS